MNVLPTMLLNTQPECTVCVRAVRLSTYTLVRNINCQNGVICLSKDLHTRMDDGSSWDTTAIPNMHQYSSMNAMQL